MKLKKLALVGMALMGLGMGIAAEAARGGCPICHRQWVACLNNPSQYDESCETVFEECYEAYCAN